MNNIIYLYSAIHTKNCPVALYNWFTNLKLQSLTNYKFLFKITKASIQAL